MKTRSLIALGVLVFLIFLLGNTTTVIAQSQAVLLTDDFVGTTLNIDLWHASHNSAGADYSVGSGVLAISSGTTEGGGIRVESNQQFTPSATEMLVFETRTVLSAADGGSWGFGEHYYNDGIVDFELHEEPVLMATVLPCVPGCSVSYIQIPDIDPTLWHTYRIELAAGFAKFYVDGELKAMFLEGIHQGKLMEIRFDRVSRGQNQTLSIDYAKVTRIPLVEEVEIDIKPGDDHNTINPRSKGVIPVAVLTTASFDATTIDPLSVRFGPLGATEAHNKGHYEDVDSDGDQDLVLHFKTQDTGIQCGDTFASLTGETIDGQAIEGSATIETVGCR